MTPEGDLFVVVRARYLPEPEWDATYGEDMDDLWEPWGILEDDPDHPGDKRATFPERVTLRPDFEKLAAHELSHASRESGSHSHWWTFNVDCGHPFRWRWANKGGITRDLARRFISEGIVTLRRVA